MQIDKPLRKSFSYTQQIEAAAEVVFPLLCPVNEEKWVPDWNPTFVYTVSGRIEKHCIFITDDGKSSSVWLVSRYDTNQFLIELFKVTPDHTVGRIMISLKPRSEKLTDVQVTYEYTALTAEGVKFLDEFTEDWYRGFMLRWQSALNYYLAHGKKLPC